VRKTDVIIVGGGPAGSACARRLRQNNIRCIVLDQSTFPRFKTCAGWITPQVLRDLQFDLKDYPHGLTSFSSFEVYIYGVHIRLPTQQYSIRRYEFDAWLLQKAEVDVIEHKVKAIRQVGDEYIVDDAFSAKYLVGAGGTHCPVYRSLFEPISPKSKKTLVVAQEDEFKYDFTDERCHLWFFDNGLPGYSWYVPKENGYLNVGVGGKAEQIKAKGDTLKNHWHLLVEKLKKIGLVRNHPFQPSGHSYYLFQNPQKIRLGNAFLAGDSLGLATLDMGEGIGPAIQSGLLAAEAISHQKEYSLKTIPRYSFPSLLRLRR